MRQPPAGQAPVVQRVRVRYAKRGRLRFTSHRDFARALERALRRAQVPIAYSAGFSPHPKISYASAAPTGVASEAEYLELGLAEQVAPDALRQALDAALPPGLDILEVVQSRGGGLADRIDASYWRLELPGVDPEQLHLAVTAFLAAGEVPVERMTKNGRRLLDARAPVVRAEVLAPADVTPEVTPDTHGDTTESPPEQVSEVPCAILDLVVRQVTPSVRPDDVLAGLRIVADLEPPVPPRATRLAQGALTERGEVADPLAADREGSVVSSPSA